jgi:pilus assembly protein CpaE
MTPTGNPTRVVALVNPGTILQQINAALSAQPEFELLVEVSEMANQPDRLVRELQASEPDLLIVDHELAGQSSLDLIDDLALQMPNSDIIAIIPEDNPLRAQQVMLAGARAFIILPFTQVNLLSTLRRVRDLQARRRQAQGIRDAGTGEAHDHNHVVAVYSPRGGAGTTSVATNLAVALAYENEGRVLLLEGKLLFGHLDVMLNIRSRNSLADLIPHATALDETLVREVVTEHISGLHVLLAPSDPQFAQGIRPQDLFNVVNSLERYYDQVVIDCGSLLNENTVTLMDAAGRILLVANPDLAALHDISRFMRISQSLAYPAEKMLLVLNRSGQEGGVKVRDIETVLHQRVFAEVPEDLANSQRSLNRGIPLIMNYPRSPASKAYRELAEKVMDFAGETAAARSA